MSHSIWERQVHDLSTRFRTIVFDNRGHGYSSKPNSNYDFDEFSSDLYQLIEQLELKDVILVGWSMGVSIVLRYFERFKAKDLSKIVLINGPIRLTSTPEFQYTMSPETIERYFRERVENRLMNEKKFIASGFFRNHEDETNWLTQIALLTPLVVSMKSVRNQVNLDMRKALSDISIPVLIEYGRHDPFYPVELGYYILQRTRDSKLVIFEESGHYPFIEESEKFNQELVDFIEGITNSK